jgi:hypothetical protein
MLIGFFRIAGDAANRQGRRPLDAVPDVDRADETLRLMCLYGLLTAAVTQAADALAADAPTLLNGDALPPVG